MTQSPVVLIDDLISEVLSFLPVKSLLQFRCVSKSWKTLISDPIFVKLHLEKSQSQKLNSSQYSRGRYTQMKMNLKRNTASLNTLLIENPNFTCFYDSHSHHLNCKEFPKGSFIVDSCNGLILLADADFKHWLRVWNPATRAVSEKFGYCPHRNTLYAFGFDNSTGTYKVVSLCEGLKTIEVRVLNLGGDDVWRNIENFPCAPSTLDLGGNHAYFSGTLNWLAIHKNHSMVDLDDITMEHYIIVSLDLETETYHEYKVPLGVAEVPPNEPVIAVLRDCLCFSYADKETGFVLWQMKKFGVEDSWTQLLKVSYYDILIDYDFSFQLMPLFLSEGGDTLILKSTRESETILYNRRDNRTKRTKIIASRTTANNRTSISNDEDDDDVYLEEAKDYVESLVPIF